MRYLRLFPLFATISLSLVTLLTTRAADPEALPAVGSGSYLSAEGEAKKLPKNLGDALTSILREPDMQNSVLRNITNLLWQSDQSNELLGFLNDLNLRPKVFHAQNTSDEAVLGVEYNFSKSIANRVFFESSKNPLGLSFNLEAKGNVAMNAKKNPEDFLQTGGALHLFQGFGGISPLIPSGKEWFGARDEATTAAGDIPPSPNWRDDPRWRKSAEMIKNFIIPQLFYDVSAHATLESDQQFHDKQYIYGGQLGVVYRDWKDSSPVRWLNLLDYPFAFLRMFKGEFSPSGRAFPALIAGIDSVDPSENDTRLAIDPSKKPYARARFEVAFKTKAIERKQQDLYFSASYRRFQELSPSSSIKGSNLDVQDYFVMKMDLPMHFNVSYSTGKLPIDRKDDQVYALGWDFKF
jgi:hypothetical protein